MLEDDTDTAFAVQAEIDTKGNVLGSKGGVAVQSGIARAEEDQLPGRDGNENTPLLGEGGGNGGAPAWEGAKDFEGLPWYKRPSVCVQTMEVDGAATETTCRYSTCSGLSSS